MAANNFTVGTLYFLLWNANGLIQHKNELELYLHENRIDIAIISETHLTSRSRLFIRNYSIYRCDHPDDTSHGGAAIIIRSTLQHNASAPYSTPHIQAATIILACRDIKFTVVATYCPPRHNITQDMFTHFFNCLGPRYLVGGDFNAKHVRWGSRLCSPRGRRLANIMQNFQLGLFSPNVPTHWPAARRKLPDLLDFFLYKGLNGIPHQITTSTDLSSDHSPVLLTLWCEALLHNGRPTLTPGITDWNSFQIFINENLQAPGSLKTECELEEAVECFTRCIQEAAWQASTPHPQTQAQHNAQYPTYIRNLIKEKRRARSRWQRTRLRYDKQLFNRLTNELKTQIRTYKAQIYDEYLSSLNSHDGSLWRCTKRILKHQTPSLPLRKEDGLWLVSDDEKGALFAEHLSQTFTTHPDIIDGEHEEHVHNILDTPLQLSPPPKAFKQAEVLSIIQRLPYRKAPGYDLITAEVLQHLPPKALVFLTTLYNSILRITHFPIQWKHSQIVMILKPNKPTQSPSSYRPISLLPLCSKIFEKLLFKRLIPIINENNIIPDHQFGFRESHSTTQQLHRVTDYIASALERKMYVSAASLDVAQAFDRVWHAGLLYKTKSILPFTYYLIIKSFLQNRYFSVRMGVFVSLFYLIQAGVPQGSILAPLLYILFTFDLPTTPFTLTATFADDKAILSRDNDPTHASFTLQYHLNLVHRWCLKWKIKLNTTKSVHTTFTLRRGECPPVFIDNQPIPQTSTVKYLGLTFDRRLTWNQHIRHKRLQLNTRLKYLYSLLNKRSILPLKQKLQIYTFLLRPVWTYGCQIFGSAKPSTLQRIQAFQSKTLRLITKAPFYVNNRTLHNDLHVPFVQTTISKLYKRFHSKLIGHPNYAVHSLSTVHLPDNPHRRLKRRWSRDLLDIG